MTRGARRLSIALALLLSTTACSSTTQASKPVSGRKTTTTLTAEEASAVSKYRAYVQQQANDLVIRTRGLAESVDSGNVKLAFGMYAQTHSSYERIRPIAGDFGDLDHTINASVDTQTVDEATGFHRLEHTLWTENTTDGMQPVAQKLVEDVGELQQKVASVDLEPAQIASSAGELLRQTSHAAVTGGLEPYSRTDLYDISANVEGTKAATDALRPLLDKVDPEAAKKIDDQFDTRCRRQSIRTGARSPLFRTRR